MRTLIKRWQFAIVIGFLISGTAWSENSDRVSFNFDVRPILSDRCFLCHGPDAGTREADLRLDTEDGAFAALEGADASHVVKPGDPRQSEVFLRVSSADPDMKMPPTDSNLSLSKEEIETLRRWIEQGAPFEGHWSFIPPAKEIAVPEVDGLPVDATPIDHFIQRALIERKLSLNPQASKERLLRRVTFDLTGLPPTIEELDAFLSDDSQNAYEKAVDRLLASSAYGERMTTEWLDVARYSDTYGYQVDRDRHVWPWRDWVIRAFNANMPYDEFITQQLAGDLLPNATQDQILATTFNRLHPQKVEGGSSPEEFRIEYVADRTQTVATAFLGLTMECCRCHDHKYDPLSQKEYYQLSAFFDKIDEAGLYSFFTSSVPTPTLLLANEQQQEVIDAAEKRVLEEEEKLATITDDELTAFQNWLAETKAPPETAIPSQVAHLDFEAVGGANKKVEGVIGSAAQLTGDDAIGTGVGNFTRDVPFSISLWMKTPDVKERAVILHRSRAWTDAGSRGYELLLLDGKLSWSLIHFWPGNAISIQTTEPLAINEWKHITITYDGSSRARGLAIYVDSERTETNIIRDNLYKEITGGGGDNIAIGERFRDRGFTNGSVDELRVFKRQLSQLEIRELYKPGTIASALNEKTANDELQEYYLATLNESRTAKRDALAKVRAERSSKSNGIAEIMVMREIQSPRPTYLLGRGAYDDRRDEVFANTPQSLPPLQEESPSRLGFAKWLTHKDHPLTARVAVNRYWQLIFGEGLVRTPEDFGSQGQLPTHPELLDWLSRDFVNHHWDVKRLIKQMVLSATYRQTSETSAELLSADPENILLGRAPSGRLSAEMLRDNSLAVSGLLVNKIGGAPAKPYEVAVSFKPVAYDKGEGVYRRSLYTYWKRTGPAPVMMALDASKRDVCRVRREQTSSPIQAFVMLNGPQFVEASRGLAQRMMKQSEDVDTQLKTLYRTLTSRVPEVNELAIVRSLYDEQLAIFEATPKQAVDYLSVGNKPRDETLDPEQLAALTSVANALFNLDECVMKR